MPLSLYTQKALLDWCTGGAAVTRPAGLFVDFQSGTPTYSSVSAAPVFRNTITFGAAVTGATASASNAAVVSCSASSSCTIFYWELNNSTSAGTRLAYGSLTASHSLLAGSQAGFAAGGLIITLA
jgi:hypothetical protein